MTQSTIPKQNENILGKLVCSSTKRYFQNEEHRRAFEKWYFEKYQKHYEWKGVH